MQILPLAPVSSQTFSAALAGQAVAFALYQLGVNAAARLFLDVTADGVSILSCRQCRAYGGLPNTRARFMLTGRHYLPFEGDLIFLDTQASSTTPTEDPRPSGLGARWQLMYLSQADLAAAGLT
jgi:hypothetical protein